MQGYIFFIFPFAFCSLIRIFETTSLRYFSLKMKRKGDFLLHFAHLFVSLHEISTSINK